MIDLGDVLHEGSSQMVKEQYNERSILPIKIDSTEETSKAVKEHLVYNKKFSLAPKTRKPKMSNLRVENQKGWEDFFDHRAI